MQKLKKPRKLVIQKRRVAMQGKAENYMATAINTAGCLLALKGYGGLAVCCWAAGKRRVAMQGKAENYMATAINTAGCLLALKGYGGLAVCCWAAGVYWKKEI